MNIKKTDVAGLFYPKEKRELEFLLEEYFKNIENNQFNKSTIVISPHAGYRFSGCLAALSHFYLKKAEIIAILSPAHQMFFEGVAFHKADEFVTPIGNLFCDIKERNNLVEKFNFIKNLDKAFIGEHGLETQLPFIKYLHKKAKILPFIVGKTSIEQVKNLIAELHKKNISIIISSDMSHFLDEENQKKTDDDTINKIHNLDYQNLADDSMCGFFSVRGLLKFLAENNFYIKNIAKDSSARITEDRKSVVGYASFLLSE